MPKADLLPLLVRRRKRVWAVLIAAVLTVAASAGALVYSSRPPIAAVLPPPRLSVVEPSSAGSAAATHEPLEQWLASLAGEAGLGLVLAPGVAGAEVTSSLGGAVDWQHRLDAVARLHRLDVRRADGLLEVAPREPEPRIAAATLPSVTVPLATVPLATAPLATAPLATARAPERRPSRPPEPRHTTRLMRLSNARAADLVSALDGPLSTGGITAGYDAATNSLVLGGPEPQLADAERLVRGLDIPRRRFLLEAHIVELSRSARHEMGVRWTLESNDLGAIVNFPAGTEDDEGSSVLVATSGSHSLRARLSALEADGRVRVISRPRIVVVEGKPASIEAVRIVRVRLPDSGAVVADADSSVSVDGGRAFEEIPAGVSLQVEPSLQGEGNVVLRIIAKSSTLGPPQPPDDIPEELSRRVEADVVVADGHTAVLGGLLREGSSRSGTGVPLLRSIPVLGALFGRRARERDVEELIVLVTPRLIS